MQPLTRTNRPEDYNNHEFFEPHLMLNNTRVRNKKSVLPVTPNIPMATKNTDCHQANLLLKLKLSTPMASSLS